MSDQSLLRQTITVLEWDRVLDMLAGRARSAMGVERCRALALESEVDAAERRLNETTEMAALLDSDDPFPSLGFPDLRGVVGRADKGAVLDPAELRDCSIALGLGHEVLRYARRHGDLPALAAVIEPLESWHGLNSIKDAIDRSVDAEGNIRESATPQLRRLMQHAHDLKQTMRRRLDIILASSRYADVLQESYFAQREGRYVVLLKSDMRAKIPGIVHDVSASGATVFLELRELVELNNSIKVAELEVEREVRSILQGLSTQVGGGAEIIHGGLEILAALDCIAAKAAFSRQVKGRSVRLNAVGRIVLKQARHPLLVLNREQVVANDLVMDETIRVLVISGPNTGGKTVTLKILGLFALMARAGLPLPCDSDSEMALFPDIYADIGDAQDLAKDLSSFSAHMTQMIALLEHAAANSATRDLSRALVLLDEPVTSTDPAEGAALAEALLVRLATLGMKVVVTTHYNSLKALAQSTPGFLNASVGFDVTTLSPTYRVMMGMPGGSSAIDIAGRLGMDESILEDALGRLRRDDRTLESLLSALQERQRRLDDDLAKATAYKEEAEQVAREAMDTAERLRRSEREERRRLKTTLTDQILRARAEIQHVMDGLKTERTLIKAKGAKQRLAQLAEQIGNAVSPAEDAVPIEQLKAGDGVEIVHVGATGTLMESPQGKKRVRVRVGEGEMLVAADLLTALPRGEEPNPPRPATHLGRRTIGQSRGDLEAPEVVDVRGKAADEAVKSAVATLDRAALAGGAALRIIHGHGTGRLKAALRAHLKDSPYVASFRPGERNEGGDGVTIVKLK